MQRESSVFSFSKTVYISHMSDRNRKEDKTNFMRMSHMVPHTAQRDSTAIDVL